MFLGNYVVNRMETSSMPDVQRAQKYYLVSSYVLSESILCHNTMVLGLPLSCCRFKSLLAALPFNQHN